MPKAFKLENFTDFDEKDLRRVILAAVKAKKAPLLKLKRVTVRYDARPKVTEIDACAWPKRGWMMFWLPRSFCGSGGCLDQFSQILEHELDHLAFGLDHDIMPDWWTLKVLWAPKAGPIRRKSSDAHPVPRKRPSRSRSGKG